MERFRFPVRNPDKIEVSPFSGIVETDALAARLGEVWAASGAIAAGARPPCAFIALERSWVQMPLPPARRPNDPRVTLLAAGSAFRGFLRLAIGKETDATARADNPNLPGLEIVAAQGVTATVTWEKALDSSAPRRIEVEISGAAGTLEGVLRAGEASPSPTEILPPLDAGPAALSSVPISFGVAGPKNWQVQVANFNQVGLGSISFSLPLFGNVTDPLLVWQPHPRLALVSSVSMTRTAESAKRPSATRELVPAEVIGGPDAPLVLRFSSGTARLPYIEDLPPQSTAHGDGRWRWPWPSLQAASAGPCPSSPEESAGVALASLTLPGIEFTPSADATAPVTDDQMRVSLRYDLPLLDELFANSKAPVSNPIPSQAAAAQSEGSQPPLLSKLVAPPTALDLVRLSDVWFESARRLARAHTEADRVVLNELQDRDGHSVVQLWHPFSGLTGFVVRGIAEPYVWKPTTFSFRLLGADVSNAGGVNLGAYCLGDDANVWLSGSQALGGLTDISFEVVGNELRALTRSSPNHIKVVGFAASSFPGIFPPIDQAAGLAPNAAHLQDARGLSFAISPDLIAAKQTSRTLALRAAPDDQTLVLATLREPASAKIGDLECQFWFRDLPLKLEAGHLTFDKSGGLETGLGPDPAAIDRNRLAKTLYEWSFFERPHEIDVANPRERRRGRFEFDLAGPLAARPLRLLGVDLTPEGGVVRLEVLVSVHYKPPPTAANDVAPFVAEKTYDTGNLAKLTFGPDQGDGLMLTGMTRVELNDPSHPTAASDPFVVSSKRIVLASDVIVYHGPPNAASSCSKTWLSFDFELGVVNNAPDIASASVRVRLFGQDCNLDTIDAGINQRGLTATFTAPSAQGDILNLRNLRLIWPKEASVPALYLSEGELAVPLRDSADSPFAFRRSYTDDTLQWLGLTFRNGDNKEVIDHDAGVITIDVTGQIMPDPNSLLFRGFFLPKGCLRGTIAVVFQRNEAGENQKWPTWPWPVLGSTFVEFAFDAEAPTSPQPQRIVAVRHRHVGAAATKDEPATWTSKLLFDAAFGSPDLNTSSVSWPVGYAELKTKFGSDPSSIVFNPDSAQPNDWNATLTMTDFGREARLVLAHQVQPRLCAHELPMDLLVVESESGNVVLGRPWSFRAVADHTLKPKLGTWPGVTDAATSTIGLTWTSVDEMCLFDMHQLVAAAQLQPDPARDRYAFLARYKGSSPDADVRIAGVVRRALADAGFPVEYVMQALKASDAPPESLVLTGAALTEVVTSIEKPEKGVALAPQWILPWAPLPDSVDRGADQKGQLALGALKDCPQTDPNKRVYDIALYDAAAGAARSLDGPPPCSFAVQDGTQCLIEGRLSAIVGNDRARTMIAVDQAILEPKGNAAPPLNRPLFPLTLLALQTVASAFADALINKTSVAVFAQRINCVTARDVRLSADGTRAAGEVRFTVTAWPVDAPLPEPAAPAVTLIVADEMSVRTEILPTGMAAALADPVSDQIVAEGQQRADALMRAFGLSANPRVVILARVDASYLTIYGSEPAAAAGPEGRIAGAFSPQPHVNSLTALGAQPVMAGRRPQVLRRFSDTIYASPAVGWPLAPRTDELAKAHARLGQEEVRRNNDQAWAGRVRSLAWPAVAWRQGIVNPEEIDEIGKTKEGQYWPDDVRETREGAFITIGQRIAFRRRAAKNLRSPPDRLSALAPARARAPTIDALADAFAQARDPLPGRDNGLPCDRPRIAPMLPGQIEVTVTGQRPGVLLTQCEGVLLTSFMLPFDKDFSRFGRSASRGPLTVRQVRAPRSSELPEMSDLMVRRKTFISADEVKADGTLKAFKVIRGPAMVVRFDRTRFPPNVVDSAGNRLRDIRSPHAITVAVQNPDFGRLSANWDGTICLIATVPGDQPNLSTPSAPVALAQIGLLPKSDADTQRLRAELQVGGGLVVFTQMSWCEATNANGDPNPKQLIVDLILEGTARDAAQALVATTLRDSSADTPVRLTIRGTEPKHGDDEDPSPMQSGKTSLETMPSNQFVSGPPIVLGFDLPHIPNRQRWLPVETFTVAFGDPAYDRELGSPTTLTTPLIFRWPRKYRQRPGVRRASW